MPKPRQRQALELFRHRILPNYVMGLLGALRLFSVGWLTGRQRALLYDINRFYGTFRDYPPPRLPRQKVQDVVDLARPVSMLEVVDANGNVTLLELLVLVHMVRALSPKVLFEIGTFDGRTTLNLAANAPPDAQVYTIDLPASKVEQTQLPVTSGDKGLIEKPESGARFKNSPFHARIHQLLGDSATYDFTPYRNTVDFAFIDGAHTYEYVRNDTERTLQLLREGKGTIFWHDYSLQPGVTTYLHELNESGALGAPIHQIEGTLLAWVQL